jgi:hypothetical protein
MGRTLQVGLAHSAQDTDHYALSGFQARFPVWALDRQDKSDRFPSFRGDRGVVTFVAAALMLKRVGVRVEAAQLNSRGSRVNASGLRFGLTAR